MDAAALFQMILAVSGSPMTSDRAETMPGFRGGQPITSVGRTYEDTAQVTASFSTGSQLRRRRATRSDSSTDHLWALELRKPASMLDNTAKQEVGPWANNRVENFFLPFRRRERTMLRFRQMKRLQKFSSLHAAFHNPFNQDRHLISRDTYKAQRSTALAEWKTLAA